MNEDYRIDHIYEDAEIYLNGHLVGRGHGEVEVRHDEDYLNTGYDHANLIPRKRKTTVKLQLREVAGKELEGDWVIRRDMEDGSMSETKFSSKKSAQEAMRLMRNSSVEGSYWLVFIPKVKEQVMDKYENLPEEEEPAMRGPDPQKVYMDSHGSVFKYFWTNWRIYPSLEEMEGEHPGQVYENRHVLNHCHDWTEVK